MILVRLVLLFLFVENFSEKEVSIFVLIEKVMYAYVINVLSC